MANQSEELIQLINGYLQQQLADKNYINEKEVLRHVVTKILFIFDLNASRTVLLKVLAISFGEFHFITSIASSHIPLIGYYT